jgi:hypothetical protein
MAAQRQLTLNQTVALIKEIAQAHDQINTVYFGDVWEFLAQTDNIYPATFFTLTGSSIAAKTLSLNFSFFFLDRQIQDESNETEVLSDQLLIAQDVFSMLRHPNFNWDITEDEKDYLAGVKMDIVVNYPMLTDRCQIPTNFNYPL